MNRYEQLLNEGKLPSPQQLHNQYAAFRERFGPSVLAGLDGEARECAGGGSARA